MSDWMYVALSWALVLGFLVYRWLGDFLVSREIRKAYRPSGPMRTTMPTVAEIRRPDWIKESPMTGIDEDERLRRKVCDWFRANGVNPGEIPVDPKASIADGRLTYLHKVQINGHDVMDTWENRALTETLTTPVLVEPDAEVWLFLAPKCPECGR